MGYFFMPRPQWNKDYSLRRLLVNTYAHAEVSNRFDNKDRDVLKGIRIEKRTVHEGTSAARSYTVFIVRSMSYPQYGPYITKAQLALGHKQRRYKHQYEVTLSLERLSIDSPVKLRTGAIRGWDFSPAARTKKMPNGTLRESKNVMNGVNGDFFFRIEWLYAQAGILFGRNFTNGPPIQTNPHGILFLDKHMIRVIETLMAHGILKQG
jgi:hypothetical protein